MAARLLYHKKVTGDELLIIDPHQEPIETWKSFTNKIGMHYLRSPSVHHLNPDPYSLKKYAKSNDYAQAFKGYYQRPRLDMFNQHCMELFNHIGLQSSWKQDTVEGLNYESGCWSVTTASHQSFDTEKVVLAMGINHQPHYPTWAADMKEEYPDKIMHVFEDGEDINIDNSIAVVGGGMTAAHLANTLSQRRHGSVTLIKRHPFRQKDFDSDPGWLGPKYLNKYNQITCYKERRAMIQEARHRGTITKGLYVSLKRQEKNKKLTIVTDEIKKVYPSKQGLEIKMKNSSRVHTDALLLATGAESGLPGREWLTTVIQEYNLPCAPCGFPVVDSRLQWKKGLFVAGALAELELGPVARNIAGARKAAARIVESS